MFLLFGSVLLAFWPLVLLLMVVAFWRVNKKNVVRVGAKLSSLSFSECSEFEPCIWLCFPFLSGHLQTVSVLFKKTKLQTWYDERCAVKLGGSLIGLWWRHGGARDPRTPVVVIFPGLTGDATSSYAVQMVEHLSPDFRCVLACPRGCGDSSLGTRPYNARDAADHVLVLEHVRSRFPNCKIFAVGFSLGANLLVNALSDFSDRLLFLQGAAALGSPWNLQRSSKLLESGLSRLLFSASLAEGLVKFYLRNEQAMNAFAFPRPVELKSLTSVRKFDAAITGPAAGYRSVDDYYEDASTHERVNNVKVPLVKEKQR